MNTVFILGGHKSGTSLLRALLDDVDGMCALPFESHFVQLSGEWTRYPRRHGPPAVGRTYEEFVERVRRRVGKLRHAAKAGGSYFTQELNADSVAEGMRAEDPGVSPATWFENYAKVTLKVLGFELDGRALVEKSVEHVEHAVYLSQLFPEARFVGIVRNPYANLVALRRFETPAGMGSLRVALDTIEASLYHTDRARRLLNRFHLVRYEDLVGDPERTMGDVFRFLEREAPQELMPTVLGEPWSGNSTSGVAFSGINAQVAEAWRDRITPLEIELINQRLSPALQLFGYDQETRDRSYWNRAKGEKLRHYLANRALVRWETRR